MSGRRYVFSPIVQLWRGTFPGPWTSEGTPHAGSDGPLKRVFAEPKR